MFLHVLTLALLAGPTQETAQRVTPSQDAAKLTTITVDQMTFTARSVKFRSVAEFQECSLEGNARLTFGDITITADRIQCRRTAEDFESLICLGSCTWRQEDGSGEVFSADKLELNDEGLRLAGNASLRFGTDANRTEIDCDAITASVSGDGYELSGKVRVRRPR